MWLYARDSVVKLIEKPGNTSAVWFMRQREKHEQSDSPHFRLVYPAIYLSANAVTSLGRGYYSLGLIVQEQAVKVCLNSSRMYRLHSFRLSLRSQAKHKGSIHQEKNYALFVFIIFPLNASLYVNSEGDVWSHIECLYLWLSWFKISPHWSTRVNQRAVIHVKQRCGLIEWSALKIFNRVNWHSVGFLSLTVLQDV